MKDKKMLYGIGIVFLFLATVGFSYAYFTASIANKDVKDQVVETGTLELTYTDGAEIKMLNIKPGQTITKKVTVKNTGTLDTAYNLVWQELNNTITNDEMVISATCKRLNGEVEEESCEGVDETPIKENIIKKNISIEPGITHEYNVTITFKETNAVQNYNQGKTFSGVLGINEYNTSEVTNCTFDGDMVQGAEFVSGQYTYRYMQEGKYSASGLGWNNVSSDGWGVQLTDKTSSEPVTSKLCTYINNKPVISMSFMFSDSNAVSIDFSNFNTSNVVNMRSMFMSSKAEILNLSSFDTSNVINMIGMFNNNKANQIDLSSFDTSKVTSMASMFSFSKSTMLDVSNFDTSKVTDMGDMFASSKSIVLDVSNFDTSKVTNMHGMFLGVQVETLDLKKFNTSNVTDMSSMFTSIQIPTINVSNFDTSKVTNMHGMFWGSQITTLDLSNFNTSNVTDMGLMFYEFKGTTIKGLNNFDTGSVINMERMFQNSKLTTIDVSKFNTSNVTNMQYMFAETTPETLNLSNFDTSNVTDMSYMFKDSEIVTVILSSFDTSKVTDMHQMFCSCGTLKTIYTSDKFVTTNVTNSDSMFSYSNDIVGGAGTKYNSSYTDKSYARVDGGTNNPGYFTLKENNS